MSRKHKRPKLLKLPKLEVPKQFRSDIDAQLSLAGINMTVSAIGIALLNYIAFLNEPLKTLTLYTGMLLTGIATCFIVKHFLGRRQNANLTTLRNYTGLAGLGIMIVVVTDTYLSSLIVPHFGYTNPGSLAPFSTSLASSTSPPLTGDFTFVMLIPFILISIAIILFSLAFASNKRK